MELKNSEEAEKVSLELVAFLAIALIIIASSILVIKAREIVHSALFLALTFVGVAALFIMLEAEFLAAIQVLIYAGAVVVLMLFAIMLTRREKGLDYLGTKITWFKGVASLVFLAVILGIILAGRWYPARGIGEGSTQFIGKQLFSYYILHFELIAILLLAAIIGAIYLARREVK